MVVDGRTAVGGRDHRVGPLEDHHGAGERGRRAGPGDLVGALGHRVRPVEEPRELHGATMASAEFDEESESKRPTVQVGDPFAEKLLLEACLELMASGAVIAIQDMGAAGLTCSAVEMGAKGDLGVDVPSGVDGDTGAVRGAAIRAVETVTFVTFKPGHLLQPGRGLCGQLSLADIGTGPAALEAGLAARAPLDRNGPDLWGRDFPRLTGASHKYTRGHALVLSGPATKTGAARLAARGALRVGAGLVTVASPTAALPENAAHLTAIMLRPCESAATVSNRISVSASARAPISPD
ncbi:hypothetical protein MOR12E_21300 [Methylobacterium oryzae]